MHMGDEICRNLKVRRHLEDLSVDGSILEWILKKYGYEGEEWIRMAQDRNQ
jgi:hypothetical protein